jgi:hypothetical protein
MKIIVIMTTLLLFFSCQEKKSDSSDDASETTDTEETDEEEQAAADPDKLAIGDSEVSPAEGLEVISTSLKSTGDSGGVSPGTLAVGLVATQCSDSGTTSVDDQDALDNGEEGKLAALFGYCNLTHSTNGPDTAQGAIARVKGILCFLDDEIEYEGEEQDLTLDFTTKCFTQSFVDMVVDFADKTSFEAVVTGHSSVPSDFDGNDKFDKAITISIEEIDFYYKVLFKQDVEAKTLAVSIRDGKDDSDDKAAFAVYLDQSESGTIRYEGLFDRDSRHVRVLAEGTYDMDEGEFTKVSNIEFLSWEDYGDSPSQAKFRSIKGNKKDGFMAVYGASDTDGAFDISTYDVSGTKSYCYGDGDCSGNTGLVPSVDADTAFVKAVIKGNDGYLNPYTWFEDHGPLTFDSVSFRSEQD